MEQALLPVAVQVPFQLRDPAAPRHRRALRMKYPERGRAHARHRAGAVERPGAGQRPVVVAQKCPRRVELCHRQLRRHRRHRPQHDAREGPRQRRRRELTRRRASTPVPRELVAPGSLAFLPRARVARPGKAAKGSKARSAPIAPARAARDVVGGRAPQTDRRRRRGTGSRVRRLPVGGVLAVADDGGALRSVRSGERGGVSAGVAAAIARRRRRAEEEGGHASKRAPRSPECRRRRRRRRGGGGRATARGGRPPGAGPRGGVTLELVEVVVEVVEVVVLLPVVVFGDGRERRGLVQVPTRAVAETPSWTTVAGGGAGDGGRAILAPQRRG